jgi:hypothetical protein
LLDIANSEEKGTATGSDMREAMGNVKPQLEIVKVKGHGANLFQMGDDTQVQGNTGLVGVVVAFTRHNSYWDSEYGTTEAGELPPCFSNDGASVASNAESPQSEKGCASCPRNRDAKQKDAREAAFESLKTQTKQSPQVCTNYLSVALAMPGRDVPVRVRFTAQAFKEWARYIQEVGTVRGRLQPHEVVTHITLDNKKGPHGEFSVPKFAFKGALPMEMRSSFDAQRVQYTGLLRRDAENEGREESASDEARAAASNAKADAEKATKKGGKSAL